MYNYNDKEIDMANYRKLKAYAEEIKTKCPIQQSDRTELSRQFLCLLNEYKENRYAGMVKEYNRPITKVEAGEILRFIFPEYLSIFEGLSAPDEISEQKDLYIKKLQKEASGLNHEITTLKVKVREGLEKCNLIEENRLNVRHRLDRKEEEITAVSKELTQYKKSLEETEMELGEEIEKNKAAAKEKEQSQAKYSQVFQRYTHYKAQTNNLQEEINNKYKPAILNLEKKILILETPKGHHRIKSQLPEDYKEFSDTETERDFQDAQDTPFKPRKQ